MTADRRHAVRARLQDRLRRSWLAHVAVLDTRLGFQHKPRAAMMAGVDHGTVCLVRSVARYLGARAPAPASAPRETVVLMVLHDVFCAYDRYLQAIFTATEMRQHFADHEVLSCTHMQREIETKMERAPHDAVVVVHLAAMQPLHQNGSGQQQYKLSQAHERYRDWPVSELGQRWFLDMARMVVRDV